MFNAFKFISIFCLILMFLSCVHDDIYKDPDTNTYQCGELKASLTLGELKAHYSSDKIFTFSDTSEFIVEAYVSSSDETGNIYKTLYIQDKPENPTQGLNISVDASNLYANFPQGSKIYIKLNGLSLGSYGNLIQLGQVENLVFGRISKAKFSQSFVRSCDKKVSLKPVVLKLNELKNNQNLIGCLIQINKAEFDKKALCMAYAPAQTSVDRDINDPTGTRGVVVRNSGYSAFANKTMPGGNGKFIGVLSKYNSTYQLYINKDTDLEMNNFPRLDDISKDPCVADSSAKSIKVAELKKHYTNSLYLINDNLSLTAVVTANDEAGNLYKYFYIQDDTGGIRVNINLTNLYLDERFEVGRTLLVNLRGMYLDNVNGEFQLGGFYNGRLGQVEPVNVYKFFFRTGKPVVSISPTEKNINEFTADDIGKWVKISNVQFIDTDVGLPYADIGTTTNRTLQDCSGKKIFLRTSNYADFGTSAEPYPATTTEIDPGKGDVYAILSNFRGTNQLWITKLRDADFDKPRCDGSLPIKGDFILNDGFSDLKNWSIINKLGAQTWKQDIIFGNPKPQMVMNAFRQTNEDWLVSKSFSLVGYTSAFVSFESDARFAGTKTTLECLATANYTGDPATTIWTKLNPILDDDTSAFGTYKNSGRLPVSTFAGGNVVLAFKYTSIEGDTTVWQIDNVLLKAGK